VWVNRCDPCCSHAWGSCSCVSAAEYFTGFAVADAAVQAEALVSDLRTQDIRIGTQDLRIAAMAVVHDARDLQRTSRCPGAWPGDRELVGSVGRSQVNANVSPWEYAGTKRACAPSIRPPRPYRSSISSIPAKLGRRLAPVRRQVCRARQKIRPSDAASARPGAAGCPARARASGAAGGQARRVIPAPERPCAAAAAHRCGQIRRPGAPPRRSRRRAVTASPAGAHASGNPGTPGARAAPGAIAASPRRLFVLGC